MCSLLIENDNHNNSRAVNWMDAFMFSLEGIFDVLQIFSLKIQSGRVFYQAINILYTKTVKPPYQNEDKVKNAKFIKY